MVKNLVMTLLALFLLFMSIIYIVITLQKQELFDLIYNASYVLLNIIYYIIELLPEKSDW